MLEGEFYDGQLTVQFSGAQAAIVRRALHYCTPLDVLEQLAEECETDTLEVEETLLGLADLLTEDE